MLVTRWFAPISGTLNVRWWRAAAAVMAAVSLSACEHKEKTIGAMVAEAIPEIEQQVGLPFKTPPVVETKSREQVREFLIGTLSDSLHQYEMRGSETAYKLFGMLPDSLSLQQLLVNLMTEQVLGFYDPKAKVLYVVDGAPQNAVKETITHELVHALQDQYINLDSVQQMRGNSDRSLAAQSMFEGQAMLEQLVATNVPLAIPGAWDRILKGVRQGQSGMPVFAAAPFVIQESLLFPYLNGAQFFQQYKERNAKNGAFNYSNLPVSTEQILHPTKFFDQRDDPVTVRFAPLPGINPTYDDDLGEFGVRLLLYDRLRVPEAIRAASGWDGDRYIVFSLGGQPALAWASVWDSEPDIRLFENMMDRYIGMLQSAKRDRRVRAFRLGTVQGREVALYVDLPEGADYTKIPMSAITIDSLAN